MRCPKCGHGQSGGEQCAACGIYFAKYQAARAHAAALGRPHGRGRGNGRIPLLPILAMLLLSLGVVFYFILSPSAPPPVSAPKPVAVVSAQGDEPKPAATTTGVAAQLATSHAPRNAIEAARNATVFIATAFDSIGSGLIVSKDCHVVTNRHVLTIDVDEQMRSLTENAEYLRLLAFQSEMLRREIEQMHLVYREMVAQRGEGDGARDLADQIERKQEELDGLAGNIEGQTREKLEEIKHDSEWQGFKVKLVDGTEYHVDQVRYADGYDLALFQLPADNCPFLSLSRDQDIVSGTRLYTIGNPSGLEYTVTSGIFSGYRKILDKRMLQTDAPINPGNSGGPLITESGRVVGINTSIMEGTEGIGFALPARAIEEAFGGIVTYADSLPR